ncbi:hypothetical protein M404DRAFT_616409 [Pisolithus tinctorius Marx 270]|uniref:Uncharacterized protein n=1 Tax=Pisolithus tinctorius Marx 270 TaxID=870435 RepID=A0A0C3NSB2_PISTI|nr:hypothetical protein M404DRAFT_616409 [Pisolithus tinctorius Marx 270]
MQSCINVFVQAVYVVVNIIGERWAKTIHSTTLRADICPPPPLMTLPSPPSRNVPPKRPSLAAAMLRMST